MIMSNFLRVWNVEDGTMATNHATVGVDHPTVVPDEEPGVGVAHLTVVPENYENE